MKVCPHKLIKKRDIVYEEAYHPVGYGELGKNFKLPG